MRCSTYSSHFICVYSVFGFVSFSFDHTCSMIASIRAETTSLTLVVRTSDAVLWHSARKTRIQIITASMLIQRTRWKSMLNLNCAFFPLSKRLMLSIRVLHLILTQYRPQYASYSILGFYMISFKIRSMLDLNIEHITFANNLFKIGRIKCFDGKQNTVHTYTNVRTNSLAIALSWKALR